MNQNTFCRNCYRITSQCCCSPVKELTDKEIEEFAKKAGVVFDERYKGEVTFISREALKRFVRAILRKAQEK